MTTVSVDLGGTNVKIALINDGKTADFFSVPSHPDAGIEQTLSTVGSVVSDLLKKARDHAFFFQSSAPVGHSLTHAPQSTQ